MPWSCGVSLGFNIAASHDNYRVIFKSEDGEFEIGSIVQHAAGTSYFLRALETQGEGKDRSELREAVQGGVGAVRGRCGQPQ